MNPPWMLVVVEGPSEVSEGRPRRGLVAKIIKTYFGDECAKHMTLRYWRHLASSPLRGRNRETRGLEGYAKRAYDASRLGKLAPYGCILLLDNDRKKARSRLLEEGVAKSGHANNVAFGIAREMIESWILADEQLRGTALPAGKRCEALWGHKSDPNSHHPKHVLARLVLDPNGWDFHDAVERWEHERARKNAPSLDAFLLAVEKLAREKGCFDVT